MHVVDASGEDPLAAWRAVRAELEAYGHGLGERPEVIALNKCDLLPEDRVAALRRALEADTGRPVFALSAATGAGVRPLLAHLAARVATARRATAGAEAP